MRRLGPGRLARCLGLGLATAGVCGAACRAQPAADRASGFLPNATRLAQSQASPGGSQAAVFAENDAGLRLEMVPAAGLAVGTRVTLRVSAKRPGYLIVLNVDPAGAIEQIYPRADYVLSAEANARISNRLDPGHVVTIPQPGIPYADSALVVPSSPGLAMALAILCDQPVQFLDLPNVPPSLAGRADALMYVAGATTALQLTSARSGARPAKPRWSFSAKFYLVR